MKFELAKLIGFNDSCADAVIVEVLHHRFHGYATAVQQASHAYDNILTIAVDLSINNCSID